MTLIFSNDNRLLFNREGSDQLLELCYGNRFTALSSYRKLYKQESTSLDCLLEPCKDVLSKKIVFSKNKKRNQNSFLAVCKCKTSCKAPPCTCTCKRIVLPSYKTELCTKSLATLEPNQKFNSFKETLFHLVKNQDTASLALQSFSAIEILSLYGLLRNQPVLIQSFLKNYFACVQSFPNSSVAKEKVDLGQRAIYSQDQTRKKRFKKFYKLLKSPLSASRSSFIRDTFLQPQNPVLSCKVFAKRSFAREALNELCTTFALQKYASASTSAIVFATQKYGFAGQNRTKRSFAKSFARSFALASKGKKWIDAAFITDCFSLLKEKISTIKQFFPKTRVWGFALGSSFLFVSMTSILQRQEQSRWLLTFSKNQMPGLSATSQESSWECFENITLKHLNTKNLRYKNPNSKGLVKHINCYNDIWYISFSEFWNHQLFHNYTAVFPRRVQSFAGKKTDTVLQTNQSRARNPFPISRDTFFITDPAQESRNQTYTHRNRYNKGVTKRSFAQAPVAFGSLFGKESKKGLSCILQPNFFFLAKNVFLPLQVQVQNKALLAKPRFACFCEAKVRALCGAGGFTIKKSKWLALPWYQMHARIPPKKQFSMRPHLFLRSKNKGLHDFTNKICVTQNGNKAILSLPRANGYQEQINAKNDSIPSKMSCSTKTKQSSFYESIKSKLARDFAQHDKLKDLFYNSSNFSIDTQIFQENSQEAESLHDLSFSLKKRKSDFEKLIDMQSEALENRFSFLQEKSFFKCKNDTNLSAQHEKSEFGLEYPLNIFKKDGSQAETLHSKRQKKYRSSQWFRCRLRMEGDKNSFKKALFFKPKAVSSYTCFSSCVNGVNSDTSSYTNFNPSLSKSAEKLSCYFLSKQNSVSNRLMSGYRTPETKDLQLKKTVCLSKVSIKVPPALPFYESKIKEWGFPLQNKALFFFINPFQFAKQNLVRGSLVSLLNKTFKQTDQSFPAIQPLKRIPYRQLFLNRSKEMGPLFEQVNKAFRISPYRLTFKRSLFTDYNDYLSWSKDTSAAISIAPSIEEEEAIKNSWFTEQALSKGLKNEALDPVLESSVQGKEEGKDLDFDEQEDNRNEGQLFLGSKNTVLPNKSSQVQSSVLDLQEALQEANLSSLINEKSSEDSALLTEEEALSASLPVGEDEEKKREITKFEWLRQVREAEHMVEKEKDLQKVAYPNREALFSKRLQVKSGMTPSLLVGDRKLSFFGITNLFPKRLIAQDQKQINLQILQEEYDQRSRLLLQKATLKKGEIQSIPSLDLESVVLIENLLKSGALYNLSTRLESCDVISSKTSSLRGSEPLNGLVDRKALRTAGVVEQNRVLAEQKPCFAGNYKSKICQKLCTCLAKRSFAPLWNVPPDKEIVFSLRTAPRNRQKSDGLIKRQHPVYAPNRRLRLRAPQLSFSSQGSNSQSRLDDLNLSQSHRWWQKRRTTSSLLGAPSKRYLVMPEITPQDWRKIVEWQLKTYLLEEEKRLEPLVLEKNEVQKDSFLSETLCQMQLQNPALSCKCKTELCKKLCSSLPCKTVFLRSKNNASQSKVLQEELLLNSEELSKTSHLFKIKKIAIYLPWTTLKKSLKRPFEWPLTGLSYQSLGGGNDLTSETVIENEDSFKQLFNGSFSFASGISFGATESLQPQSQILCKAPLTFATQKYAKRSFTSQELGTPCVLLRSKSKSFTTNKKTNSCFVSSIAPHFKTSFLCQSNQISKPGTDNILPTKFCFTKFSAEITLNKLHETSVYKPFLFEAKTKDSYLLFHQLLLAVATKQLFQSIYKVFEKVIAHKIKDSSLAILLLPIFFNATSQKNQIPEFSQLKKRLKNLVGSEDTVASLSEIVWYLRNSCRGRTIPRGVVLVETFSSESTEALKAIGGEAQVPVIVQSLRALPFTQNHPQRHFEKILTFAQNRAPCILFLDDLDSIGQSRTLLLKNNYRPLQVQSSALHGFGVKDLSSCKASDKSSICNFKKTEPFSFASSFNQISGNNGERLEKRKWKKVLQSSALQNNSNRANRINPFNTLTGANLPLSNAKQRFAHFEFLGAKPKYRPSSVQSHLHACSSHFRYKPFVKQETNKRFVQQDLAQQGFAGTNSEGPMKDNKVLREQNLDQRGLQTEKIVEQRRVDLMLRLLTVMDGVTDFNGVLIVTTSKNPSSLDPALLRPGRFEKLINIKLPNKKKRIELLKLETAKIGHTTFMPWEYLATQTQDMTGTEISSAVNHSAFRAILQSTVHTFSTLEYGISCINGDGSLTQTPEVQLENRFQRRPKAKEVGVVSNESTRVAGLQVTRKSACFLRRVSVQNPYKALLNRSGGLSTRFCENQMCLPASREFTQLQNAQVLQVKARSFACKSCICTDKATCKSSCNYKSKICQNLGTPCKEALLHVTQKQVSAERCQQSKRFREIASQISFYQAGKGVVRSSIFPAINPSYFCKAKVRQTPLTKFYCANFSPLHQKNCWKNDARLVLQNSYFCKAKVKALHKKKVVRTRNEKYQQNGIRSSFAENVVRLYAGQASESLYLESIAAFKTKAFPTGTLQRLLQVQGQRFDAKSNLFLPLLFLQSTFSYKEISRASSTVTNIVTNSGFYPKTNLVQSFAHVHYFCKAKVCKTEQSFAHFCNALHAKRNFACKACKASCKSLPLLTFAKQKSAKICKKHCTTFATSKENSFCFQEIRKGVVRKLQYLSSTNFFKKGFCVGYNKYIHLRKCLQLYKNNGGNDLCKRISLEGFSQPCNRIDKTSLWAQQVSGTLKTFKRPSGNWYRLYLPKIEQNKNNREWLLPDFFYNQHISILKQKDLQNRVRKLQISSKCIAPTLPLHKKLSFPSPAFVRKNRLLKQLQSSYFCKAFHENCADFSYYRLILSSFYVAFQSCTENRELLDLLADHLIRFKSVRLHEIVRISSFYF